MDPLLLVLLLLVAGWLLKVRQQRERIALLAGFLGRFRIEKSLEKVTQGYLRALGEADPVRQGQVWRVLADAERDLCTQVTRLAADLASADPQRMRVSKLPLWAPLAIRLFPSFDLREALAVHARGICEAMDAQAGTSARDRAYVVSAELFLLQHTCHWYCKSRLVASARMLGRHQTSYDQLLASVLPRTREDYLALVR